MTMVGNRPYNQGGIGYRTTADQSLQGYKYNTIIGRDGEAP